MTGSRARSAAARAGSRIAAARRRAATRASPAVQTARPWWAASADVRLSRASASVATSSRPGRGEILQGAEARVVGDCDADDSARIAPRTQHGRHQPSPREPRAAGHEAVGLPTKSHPLRLCPAAHRRRNWLFTWLDVGGERTAAILTIIATCISHDVNPRPYLHLVTRLIVQG